MKQNKIKQNCMLDTEKCAFVQHKLKTLLHIFYKIYSFPKSIHTFRPLEFA